MTFGDGLQPSMTTSTSLSVSAVVRGKQSDTNGVHAVDGQQGIAHEPRWWGKPVLWTNGFAWGGSQTSAQSQLEKFSSFTLDIGSTKPHAAAFGGQQQWRAGIVDISLWRLVSYERQILWISQRPAVGAQVERDVIQVVVIDEVGNGRKARPRRHSGEMRQRATGTPFR